MARLRLNPKKIALVLGFIVLQVVLLVMSVHRVLASPVWGWSVAWDILLLPSLISAGCFLLLLVSVWWTWRVFATRVTEDGIVQPGLFGQSRVRWVEATRIDVGEGFDLKLRGAGNTVSVPVYMYEQPLGLVEHVLQKLRESGRAAA